MIKLERGKKPEKLTKELEKKLTQEFQDTGGSVWSKPLIKKELLKMSNNKCCYCETRITEESKYMEVDHFYCKKLYPEKVVEWENLLPSCKRCNGTKKEHDVKISPIINPTDNEPKNYLYFKNYRYKSINNNEVGKKTIAVLNLNDFERLIKKRFEIGEHIQKKLEDIYKFIKSYNENEFDVENENHITNSMTDLLRLALPKEEYSALAATIILEDYDFKEIKENMIRHELWNEEMAELENNAKNICLSLKTT